MRDTERIERIIVKLRQALERDPDADLVRVLSSAFRSRMWHRFTHLSRHLNDPEGVKMDEHLLGYILAFDDISFEKYLDAWMKEPPGHDGTHVHP